MKNLLPILATAALLATGCNGKQADKSKETAKQPKPSIEETAMLSYASSSENLSPSVNPPGGLKPEQVPMFIAVGFDDNGVSGITGSGTKGGLSFVTKLFASVKNPQGSGNPDTWDGSTAHFTFYGIARAIDKNDSDMAKQTFGHVRRAWREAIDSGNEFGCHTYSHDHGADSSLAFWNGELKHALECYFRPYDPAESLDSPKVGNGVGVMPVQISGFRTPYLEYNDNTFSAVKQTGFLYDCSIEEGVRDNEDGTNFLWPYTLDNGSPGNEFSSKDTAVKKIGKHPGLWELPAYVVIVPPDSLCAKYGVKKGLREKFAKIHPDYFDVKDGKITGLDWNLWCDFYLSKAEFLAVLKYSFDLRESGNRAPFLFGCHSDIYSDCYPDSIPHATWQDRQAALREFLQWAAAKPEVRIVSMKQVLDWIRKPVPLQKTK